MHIAVVDDQKSDLDLVTECINRYSREHHIEFQTDAYLSSVEFLEKYHGQYDIVFLDIEMPGSTGLEAAEEIRRIDETTALLFITSVARYAVDGYRYQALDFMVKPVKYEPFTYKLQKALDYAKSRSLTSIEINAKEGIIHVPLYQIAYLDKDRNYIRVHMKTGRAYEVRGSMKHIQSELPADTFAELSKGCIVNLNYVKKIEKDIVTVNGDLLPLPRRSRKAFLEAFMNFVR